MKQLSSIELNCIVKELQFLIDSKVDKIYQPNKKIFLFQLYVPNKGKYLLKIIIPNLIFLTEYKEQTENTEQYSMFLRKYLANSRLKSIKQLGSERILQFEFEKENKLYLIVELFSKGNLILCDKEHIIINPLEIQKWKDRTIKKGEKYIYPKREYNIFDIKEKQLEELFQKTKKSKIVTALASDLGLGGTHAEETCIIANIEKNTPPEKADPKIILNAIKKIINKPQTLSKDLDEHIQNLPEKPKTNYEKKIQKLKTIIEKQTKRIEQINVEIKENKEKGEAVYHNYKIIDEILREINKARIKYSWKEIKHRLKEHKIIKNIDEKESKIIIEI